MHLMPEMGMTVDEIRAAGFDPVCLPTAGDTPDATFANTVLLYGRWFAANAPACVVILGDRYEMLAVASAAVMHNVPIVHIAGELSPKAPSTMPSATPSHSSPPCISPRPTSAPPVSAPWAFLPTE